MSDGPKLLSIIAAPLMHLKIGFNPTDCVSLKNLREWLAIPDDRAVGSTWVATKQILAYKTGEILHKLRQAIEIVAMVRG